jgi:hypothetical protein
LGGEAVRFVENFEAKIKVGMMTPTFHFELKKAVEALIDFVSIFFYISEKAVRTICMPYLKIERIIPWKSRKDQPWMKPDE